MRCDKISTMTPELKEILDEVDFLDYFHGGTIIDSVRISVLFGILIDRELIQSEDLKYELVTLDLVDFIDYLNERYCNIIKSKNFFVVDEERLNELELDKEEE